MKLLLHAYIMHTITSQCIVGYKNCSEPNLLGGTASTIMNCWKHTCILSRFLTIEEAFFKDREAHEAIQKKELKVITFLLEQLALVSKESESRSTMNAHKFIN